ncbi:DUF222 domain-containing protein [Actinotalea ferrariae]|uniref:DUF222 domain-containing protein n=1 Tax=Actinotalea ferrariae TaxID=1386098 RepID=UPI0012DBF602|nr:DUF222 domain-containing protein [Actinotalea ferrariae]
MGRVLADVPGGPDLAATLVELESWAWDAGSVVEVVAAYERVASWARAGAADAAARLAALPEMNPSWPGEVGRPTESNGASTELSLRLGVSRRAAATLVGTGQALRTVHHGTGEALAAGLVDWPKARVIVGSLEHVAPVVALAVEDSVLPTAPGSTPAQLRRQIARLLEEIDPDDAADRHEHARARRCVTRPRALPDGMASMTATLTVEAAVRLDACLQAAAERARSDGDLRSTDQLRADALDAMGEVAWTVGFIGLPGPSTTGAPEPMAAHDAARPPAGITGADPGVDHASPGQARAGQAQGGAPADPARGSGDRPPPHLRLGRRTGPPARVHVTVGLGTLLGLDDRPGELAGFGPISADVARRLAMDGTWRRLLVDEPSGTVVDIGTTRYVPPPDMIELVRERNRTCVIPTCGMPARSCQTDHTVPFPREAGRPAVERPPAVPLEPAAPNEAGSSADREAPNEAGSSADRETPNEAGSATGREAPNEAGSSADRETPNEAGSSADPEAPNEAGSATGREAPTLPPLSGESPAPTLPAVDPPALAEPGAPAPKPSGRTAVDNLGPLCATHHLFKTHGGFRLEQPRPGAFVVRTPSGHVYLQEPDRPPGIPAPRPFIGAPVESGPPPF